MQDKQITNTYKNPLQMFSPRERSTVAEIKELWLTTQDLSPEAMEQLVLTLPASYQGMVIQVIAKQFVNVMTLHVLQLAALFYQQAEKEGISAEDRDETLQDIEADLREMLTLDQRLNIDSVENLFRVGRITASEKDISQSDTAEEAQRSLYAIPGIYQGRLEREHLIREEKLE